MDGYAPLRDYAAIGDGRTAALVARDGSIDWLCLPDLDSPAVFGALLDARSGGGFALCPIAPFDSDRRYLPGTNVLETTFRTATGVVRVTDAMTVPSSRLCPQRELVRAVEAATGSVSMRWRVSPRFGFGSRPTRIGRRAGIPVATRGADAMALRSWGAGEPQVTTDSIGGHFDAAAGAPVLFSLGAAHQEPLVIPGRGDVMARLEATVAMWREWSEGLHCGARWRDAVVRSALALKLLVHAPSGAIAAAATTSLPEVVGGERNWDYRFCWVRDSAFMLGALLRLGCVAEADAFFWWLMQASQLTHPRLRVLYGRDGGAEAAERTLPLAGYRSSAPVRVGNAAADQVQLDVYGDLFQAAWLYAEAGRPIDADIARRLAEIADLVCGIWSEPDAGLWEVRSAPQHFTQSKMMCFVALDRALRLARAGRIPGRNATRWQEEANAIRAFVDERCWSTSRGSYVRHPGSDDVDASLLLGVLFRYGDPSDPRLIGTVEVLRRELTHGPFVHRYTGEDGLAGTEGAFLTCSFWLAEALAVQGRRAEAAGLMAQLVGLANDVGLFAEEIDPATGEFLGNLPQGLTHLALIHAALAFTGADVPWASGGRWPAVSPEPWCSPASCEQPVRRA
ncbi:MAG: glycoside hydrolase family 15 protein [Acidimicrobiales bacterium]